MVVLDYEESISVCVCVFVGVVSSFLSLTFCQYLLDSLLFFQQEGAYDALFEASRAARSSVGTGDGAFSLFQIGIGSLLQMLNARKRGLAIGAFRSLGRLLNLTSRQLATGSTSRTDTVRFGVVRMTSGTCVASITHDLVVEILFSKREKESVTVVRHEEKGGVRTRDHVFIRGCGQHCSCGSATTMWSIH